jgi:hypothetical protein
LREGAIVPLRVFERILIAGGSGKDNRAAFRAREFIDDAVEIISEPATAAEHVS